MNLLLDWEGPLRIGGESEKSLFLNPTSLSSGVYIWTALVENKHWAYYVGETGSSFIKRHLQHLTAYYNGEYKIYEGEAFSHGKKLDVWEGAYGPKNRHKLPAFKAQSSEFNPRLQDFIARLNFFLIPVEGDRRVRERLELAISKLICQDGGLGNNFQDDIRYRHCRADENPICFQLKRALPIVGLSDFTVIEIPLQLGPE